MRKVIIVLFLAFGTFAHAFYDEELDQLWKSIPDINNPTLQDYRQIEKYLYTGKRPYLNLLHEFLLKQKHDVNLFLDRLNRLMGFRFVGSQNEMPIFEKHSLNIQEHTKKRCILLFASYNRDYPAKARQILRELKQNGYSGDVLLRIGGFPNTQSGGLKLCHVPYAFKIAFLQEARSLGYEEILWLDSAMHPLSDLEGIFTKIREFGYYLTGVGYLCDNARFNLIEAAEALNITKELYYDIPHLAAGIIGLNLQNPKGIQFIDQWLIETEKVIPNVTWYPDELSLSVVAWRCNFAPLSWFWNLAYKEENLLNMQYNPEIHFYLDTLR